MSQRVQLAHSRNFTLQKQLEDRYTDLRRTFKYSRRRLDTMEEDCVASLYKLLLYIREQQGITETQRTDLINDVFRGWKSDRQRPQSVFELPTKNPEHVEDTVRPATAMSAKTYTQSYSFVKDGMNIDKTRRERYLRSKADKERQKENNIRIERLLKDGEFSFERPETVESLLADNEKKETISRPKTAGPTTRRPEISVARPQTSSCMQGSRGYLNVNRASTPNTVSFSMSSNLDLRNEYNSEESGSEEKAFNDGLHDKPNISSMHSRPSTSHRRLLTSPQHTTIVHENSARVDGAKSPITVRITTTHFTDATQNHRLTDTPTPLRPDSEFDNPEEDELIPLEEEDKDHLDRLIKSRSGDHRFQGRSQIRPNTPHSRLGTTQGVSRSEDPQANKDESILKKSMERTQTFLKQYSKKSKVFGYVVKTRSSIIAPRERIVAHRSPCITYQELVSIKAGIKQQESKTKSLLQRSAKLSTYVDKLVKAGKMRETIRERKQANIH